MTKEELIDYANRSLYGIWASDSEETMKYISEFCLMRDPEKGKIAIQIYLQVPEEIKRKLVQKMIDYYCQSLNVNYVSKVINTPLGEQYQIIKYI